MEPGNPPVQPGTPEAVIRNEAAAYEPAKPLVTVETPVTEAVTPVVSQAERDQADAQRRLREGQEAVQATEEQLTALYSDMDDGLSLGLIAQEKRLREQLQTREAAVATAQSDYDTASATVAAGNVVLYSEQASADRETAVASSNEANRAYQTLTGTLPEGVTLSQGQTLSDRQAAALTPEQRTAYETYLRAQTTAANDQARFNADTAIIDYYLARLQELQQSSGQSITVEQGDTLAEVAQQSGVSVEALLSGNPQLKPELMDGVVSNDAGDPDTISAGDQIRVTAAMRGLSAVNEALEPLSLQVVAPPTVDAATAASNFAATQEAVTYYSAVWNATDSAVRGFDATLNLSNAQQRLIALEQQIKDYERQNNVCLAPGSDLVQQRDAAKAALQQAQTEAAPFTADYNVKVGYLGTLQARQGVEQAEAAVGVAQDNYNAWVQQNPNLAAPGNPPEMALADANRTLSLARQQEEAANAGFLAAYGEQYAAQAELDVENAWTIMNGGRTDICIANPDPAAMAAWQEAQVRATGAREAAQGFRIEADRIGADFQVNMAQQTADAARQRISTLEAANADPAQIASAREELTQAETALREAQETKGQADFNAKFYEFEQSLAPELRAPQTEEQRAEAERLRAEFFRANQFDFGPIDNREAIEQVRQDLEAQRDKLANRGWMQSSADGINEFFGGDRSELETFIERNLGALQDLESRRAGMSEADYQAELHRLLDNYGENYLEMSAEEAESDRNWETANQITRTVVATGVGILVTVGTGGNIALGAAAGFGTYQVWSGADDAVAEMNGGDSTADGHLSLVGYGIEAAQGDVSADETKMMLVDTTVDAVSSLAGSGGVVALGRTSTQLAARTLPGLATHIPGGLATRTGLTGLHVAARGTATPQLAAIAAQNTSQSLGLRMLSTAGGLTVNQGIQSGAQIVNSTIRVGANGQLFTEEGNQILAQEARNQAFYLASAPVVGLVAGRFGPGIRTQAALDLSTNFVQEESRALLMEGRHLNGLEAYAATIGAGPGTMLNIAAHVGSGAHRRLQPPDEALVDTQIRQRAEQIWEEAGRPEGQAEAHWRQARNEVLGLDTLIAERANQIWEEAGRPEGQADAHWRQAETEILGLENVIAERAYQIWEEAGRPEGLSQQHWQQAALEIEGLQTQIADRARQIWDQAGRPEGQDVTVWQRAESEIRQLQPQIASRANELWVQAGRPEGQALTFWTRAENEVLHGLSLTDDPVYAQTAQRAQQIWEDAGRPEGQDQQHWRQAEAEILRSRIEERAHQLWDQAGRPEGNSQAYWLQAEAEIKLRDEAVTFALTANGEWRGLSPSDNVLTRGQSDDGQSGDYTPGMRNRRDGTPILESPVSPNPYGFEGVRSILRDTMARLRDRTSGEGPLYTYPRPGDLVDSVYGLPVRNAAAGSEILLDVNGTRVKATVVEVTVPRDIDTQQYIYTSNRDQASGNGLIGDGTLVERAWRVSKTGTAGQDRWNTRGDVAEGHKSHAGTRSELGQSLADTLGAGPDRWTGDLIARTESYLAWADTSSDPLIRHAAENTRALLGRVMPRDGSDITPQQLRAMNELLGIDAASYFTAAKPAGELSGNGGLVLNIFAAQSGRLADLTPQQLAARLDPSAPSPLSAVSLTGDGSARWTAAGQEALTGYLNQALKATDPDIKARAEEALVLIKGRRSSPGRTITSEQAEAVLAVLRADQSSRWMSGIQLSPHPTFKGEGELSQEGRDVADLFAALSPTSVYRELRQQVSNLRQSPDAAVRQLATELYGRMPERMPKPGTEDNSRIFQQLLMLREAAGETSFRLPEASATRGGDAVDPKLQQGRWDALRKYVKGFTRSQDAEVRQAAAQLYRDMPRHAPKAGEGQDTAVYQGLIDLMAADRASPWRVSRTDVDWQSVYRPDRSTISQLLQEDWTVLFSREGGNFGFNIALQSFTGSPFGLNLPIPSRQVYMEWSVKNNGPEGTGFVWQVHPDDVNGQGQFANGSRPGLIHDPQGDPARPWVMRSPMLVKLTAQTEVGAGLNVLLGFSASMNYVWRKVRYLGSHDGRAGYLMIEPMRLTNAEAKFIEGAFRGGVNHYHGEGSRVGPVWDGERLLFRNYITIPVFTPRSQGEWWRRGIFEDLPREYSIGPRRVQDRIDHSVGVSFGAFFLSMATAEAGSVIKKLSEHVGTIRPHPLSSPQAQAVLGELAASRRWTPQAETLMREWIDRAVRSEDAEYRAAGEWAQQTLLQDIAMTPQERRQLLNEVRAWARENDASPTSRDARRAQLREAKLHVRNMITAVQYDVLDQLLMHDIRVNGQEAGRSESGGPVRDNREAASE